LKRENASNYTQQVAFNIVFCLSIVAMVALPEVIVGDHTRCIVWDCSERSKHEHLLCKVFGKLFKLFSDVTKESVA
jgi:hypothetical protein